MGLEGAAEECLLLCGSVVRRHLGRGFGGVVVGGHGPRVLCVTRRAQGDVFWIPIWFIGCVGFVFELM